MDVFVLLVLLEEACIKNDFMVEETELTHEVYSVALITTTTAKILCVQEFFFKVIYQKF